MALPTDLDTLLARVDALRDEIDALRPLTPEQEGRAMQRLRIEWTYHSNAIEGNSLTYGETRALLMHGVTAHGKPLKDHLDIRRHREVIEYLEAFVRSDEPLTLAVVRELHKMLMGDDYEVSAEAPDGERVRRTVEGGAFKTLPNNVVTQTGETHYYASPEETPALMADLLDAFREPDAAHPVVRAALFHHRFVEVHPFPDGNGRTARVLMNLLLMRAGYVPAVLRQDQRPAYYGALSEADGGGDTVPIVAFVAGELAETMELYLRALKGEPDPTAFSKRVDILHRVTETIGPAVIDRSRRVALSQRLVRPLYDDCVSKADQLKQLFGLLQPALIVSVESGHRRVGPNAVPAIASGSWVSVTAQWQFRGLVADPSFDVAVRFVAKVSAQSLTISAGRRGEEWKFTGVEDVSSETVGDLATALFEPAVAQVERHLDQM